MKKIFPYLSVVAGFLIIGLYMYSTVSHEEFIKEQEQLIVKEQQMANAIKEEDKILWKNKDGDLIYKSTIEGLNLKLTVLKTDDVKLLPNIDSNSGDKYSESDDFVFWIKEDEAIIIDKNKIIDRLSAVY